MDISPSEHDEAWQFVDPLTLRTSSLKAAARFRPYANEICEKVFIRAFSREVPAPTPCRLPSFLDPHQKEGVMHILTRTRSYLAHAPGAGKTAQLIVAGCMLPPPGQIVIVVPPSLTANWEREIMKFTSTLMAFPTIGIVGRTAQRKSVAWRSDFLLIPNSMLPEPWVYERLLKMKIKLLGIDEASGFKDPDAARTKAAFGGKTKYRTYPGLVQNARHVVLLDGSPMPNRPMELWAPTYALDPEAIDCMEQRDFGFRYCGATMNERGQWEFKNSSNEAELREKLQKRFMHVVTEDRLAHPERRRSLLFMNQDVRTAEMRSWERRNLKLLSTKEGISENLSQGEVASHRRELGIRKVPWVARYILNRIKEKPNEKILLFAWHREVCQSLYESLSRNIGADSVAIVLGGTTGAYRERAFASFQSSARGSVRVIVGNIAAMGRGHNLQKADRIVFAEPSWSDELNKQCEKRASRRGREQESFVRCEYVVVPDSLDERVMRSLFAKESRVKRVIG